MSADIKETICQYVYTVVNCLNRYMIECPEIILDKSKNNNLFYGGEFLDNKYLLEIASFYGTVLKWKYADEKGVNIIAKACNQEFPAIPKDMAIKMNKCDKDNKADLRRVSESIIVLKIATNMNRINASYSKYAPSEMMDALSTDLLINDFNQVPTEYNKALLSISLKRIVELTGNG